MAIIRPTDPGAERLLVFDADTGERIRGVLWADPETGEYEQVRQDAEGRFLMDGDDLATDLRRGRIMLLPMGGRADA